MNTRPIASGASAARRARRTAAGSLLLLVLCTVAWLIASCSDDDAINLADLCFDASVLPDGFVAQDELLLEDGRQLEQTYPDNPQYEAELRRLYEEWGRTSVVLRSYSRPDTESYAKCKVELYEDAEGAATAFAETGFIERPLRGRPEIGTFREMEGDAVGAESRRYLSAHAVIVDAAILFRTGNAVARVDVVTFSGSIPEEWPTGNEIVDYAATLADALLQQIEDATD